MEQACDQFEIIAHIESDYDEKFGVPRQSGLVSASREKIVFEKPYRSEDALRGLEGYSHLWVIWRFSGVPEGEFHATVRPPRLGGNERLGVFATRSPFRPNRIALSSVKLEEIVHEGETAPYLVISGGDMMNGTPVLDIKPYMPYTDAHPEARSGFSNAIGERLSVICPPQFLSSLQTEKRQALLQMLALDPRPTYQSDPDRIYGVHFAGMNVRFQVRDGVLTVVSAQPQAES